MPGKDQDGYVLDVQAELLTDLSTPAVIPLLPENNVLPPMHQLNPVFEIEGRRHVMVTQAIATIPIPEPKHSMLSLGSRQDEIRRALDSLLLGF
jgi:toxin CcdB